MWGFFNPISPSPSPIKLTETGEEKDTGCRHGVKCYDAKCAAVHPSGWNPCPDGVKCKNYDCIATHPYRRKAKCRAGEIHALNHVLCMKIVPFGIVQRLILVLVLKSVLPEENVRI